MNEVEAREISGSSDIEVSLAYMKNKYPSLKVILTLGASGCIYSAATERFFYPAYSVTAVDTTAAGDTFAGYFAATVAGGGSCREAVRLATAASAIAVSRPGAAPSIPEREEVLSILPSLRPAANPSDGDKIREKIESYVDESLRDARLDALAEILGYSSVYTSEVVKRVMGKSFSKLLQDKRCTLAAKMLAETDMTVERIIYTLGYENESFFRKIFKEKYGTTPFEYRKNIKKR
jgi:AraC-like DNA-binding protein